MYMFWGLALGQVQENSMARNTLPTAEQAAKQRIIDAYVAARIRYLEARRASERAATELGAASARMEMHWWKDVPAKYR